MLESEFRFKVGKKNFIIAKALNKYSFLKFIIRISLVNFRLDNFIFNIINFFSLLPLINILSIKHLSSSDFTSSDIKRISKIMQKIDMEIKKNTLYPIMNKYPFLQINGWEANKLSHIIFHNLDHTEIKYKIKKNVKRKDLRAIKGVKYYKSGFSIFLELEKYDVLNHIVGVPQNMTDKYLFNITPNVKFTNTCKTCSNKEHIGFIDDIKPYFLGTRLNKAEIFSNLIIYDSYFFTKIIKLINDSLFYKNFIDLFYLKILNIIEPNIHLLDLRQLKNSSSFSSTKNGFKMLSYSVDNCLSTNISTYNKVELFYGKFLIKNNKLLNRFDTHLDKTLIAGEENLLIQDRNHDLKTGIFIDPHHSKKFLNEVIVLPSLVTNNYFHFLLENCVGLWSNLKDLSVETPILLPSSIHKNMLEILRLIGFNNFIFFNKKDVFSIDNVITFTKSAKIIDDTESDLNLFYFDKVKTREFSDYILNIFYEFHKKIDGNKKNFLIRNSTSRFLENQDSLCRIAVKNGYKVVNPEELSFIEQVGLFYTSSDLIIVGGASMANLIFTNTNSNIVYIVNNSLKKYKLVDELASIRGNKINYLYGKTRMSEFNHIWNSYNFFHSNYIVNESSFRKYLQQ